MKEIYTGHAYVLGDDIDTDAIIPAEYLNLSHTNPDQRDELASYSLSGLPEGSIPFIPKGECRTPYQIIIAGKNFGCGSSRAQAPGCLHVAGVQVVVAEYYARIFFRNSVNAGLLLPLETQMRLCEKVQTGDELKIDINQQIISNLTQNEEYSIKPVGAIKDILEAGNLFEYAKIKFAKNNAKS